MATGGYCITAGVGSRRGVAATWVPPHVVHPEFEPPHVEHPLVGPTQLPQSSHGSQQSGGSLNHSLQ